MSPTCSHEFRAGEVVCLRCLAHREDCDCHRCTKTTTDTVLGCPAWCDIAPERHEPAWHEDALHVDHNRTFSVEGVGTVLVMREAVFRPSGSDALVLSLGPVTATVEVSAETVTPAGLRALARALQEAAELAELQVVQHGAVCSGIHAFHQYVMGRCYRCGQHAPGVMVEAASSGVRR